MEPPRTTTRRETLGRSRRSWRSKAVPLSTRLYVVASTRSRRHLDSRARSDQIPELTSSSRQAGRIPAIDLIAAQFFGPTATRTNLLASASAIAKTLTDGSAGLADYYLKVMAKYVDSAEGVQTWLVSESERLGKLASKKGSVAAKKLDELRMKQNVSLSFRSSHARELTRRWVRRS